MAKVNLLAQPDQKPKRKAPPSAWKPGQSGNPKGRPAKSHDLTAALVEIVDKQELGKKLYELALGGDMQAVRYIYDRIEGTPPQRIQVEINDARKEAERMADDLGLEGEARKEAVETAVRLLQEARG